MTKENGLEDDDESETERQGIEKSTSKAKATRRERRFATSFEKEGKRRRRHKKNEINTYARRPSLAQRTAIRDVDTEKLR